MYLIYDRLDRISKTVPPYRGTTDRFPLLDRKHNTKNFYVRWEDGHKVFDITYGQRWRTEELSKEQYDSMPENFKGGKCFQQGDKYFQYVTEPNFMGTVRPRLGDGEFEFNADSYGSGDMKFLSDLYAGVGGFASKSRMGGMTYWKYNKRPPIIYPIYRGMKVNARTMMPVVPHEVVVNHVDRKKSKALLRGYERFFKVSEVMLKSLTMDQVLDIGHSFINDYGDDERNHGKWVAGAAWDRAEDCMDEAPLDAFIWYCIAYDIGSVRYLSANPGNRQFYMRNGQESAYDKLFMATKRRIVKEIYKRHSNVFKEVRFACGEAYPACDWGTKVIVNGQEVEQYK